MRIDKYIDCLNCGKDVAVKDLDNVGDILEHPESYTMQAVSDKCECGLITVIEFEYSEHDSMRSTQMLNPDWAIYKTGKFVCKPMSEYEEEDSD
jgi:hypothetical protein